MAKYRLTNKTTADLINIWDYTLKEWSQNQAEKYYSQLISAFNHITGNQSVGKSYSEVKNNLFGFSTGKHIIFYQLENEQEILIVRILHENMDLENRLNE